MLKLHIGRKGQLRQMLPQAVYHLQVLKDASACSDSCMQAQAQLCQRFLPEGLEQLVFDSNDRPHKVLLVCLTH